MNRLTTTTLALALLAHGSVVPAAETPQAPAAPAAVPAPETPPAVDELHFVSKAEEMAAYETALKAAEDAQRDALKSVEAAREQLEQQAREAEQARRERERAGASQAEADALAQRERALAATRERERAIEKQLENAHENLRRASREVARVHRELNRPLPPVAPAAPTPGGFALRFAGSERPVIGVVLGGAVKNGVPVLGVSPDGPADRAGIEPGDVIVSIMGQPLAGGDEDPRAVLSASLEGIKVGDELQIGVDREGDSKSFTVTVAAREPFTWHGLSRLATAPEADDSQIVIERIEVPEIDRAQLDSELSRIREQMDVLRLAPGVQAFAFSDGDDDADYTFEFEGFSDFGDTALAGTDMWFGMPLTRGIKMTELDDELGAYFNTERGVLVLKATADNGLQLRAGDVILKVAGSEVETPADVMRALRNVESGSQVEIDIKREKRNRTVTVEVPENRVGLMLHGRAVPTPKAAPAAELPPTAPAPDRED